MYISYSHAMHRGVSGLQDGTMTESRRKRLHLDTKSNKGMTLPFRPLNLAFQHMYYSVDMPPVRPHPSFFSSLAKPYTVR